MLNFYGRQDVNSSILPNVFFFYIVFSDFHINIYYYHKETPSFRRRQWFSIFFVAEVRFELTQTFLSKGFSCCTYFYISKLHLSSATRGDFILWLYLHSVQQPPIPYLDIRVFAVWTILYHIEIVHKRIRTSRFIWGSQKVNNHFPTLHPIFYVFYYKYNPLLGFVHIHSFIST